MENSYGVVTAPQVAPPVDYEQSSYSPKHTPDPNAQPMRSALGGSGKVSSRASFAGSERVRGVSFGDAIVHEFEVEAEEVSGKEKKKDKWDKTFFHEIRDLFDEPEVSPRAKPKKKAAGGRRASAVQVKVTGDMAKLSLDKKIKLLKSPPPSPPRSEADDDESTATATPYASTAASPVGSSHNSPMASRHGSNDRLSSAVLSALAKNIEDEEDAAEAPGNDDDDDLADYERALRKVRHMGVMGGPAWIAHTVCVGHT